MGQKNLRNIVFIEAPILWCIKYLAIKVKSKKIPVSKADNLTTASLSGNFGTLIFWNPLGTSNPVMGLVYLFDLSTERTNTVRNQLMFIFWTILPSSKSILPVPKTIHNILKISTFVSRNHMFNHIVRLICTFPNTTYTTTKRIPLFVCSY